MRRRKPGFPNNNANRNEDDARFPVRNEIPDSANVRANQAPGADVPISSVQNERESRQQQLNLGKEIIKSWGLGMKHANFFSPQVALSLSESSAASSSWQPSSPP